MSQDKQSRFLPIFLICAGIAGAIYSAWNGFALIFACFAVLACIGVRELLHTDEFNEQ